ncbi:DNA topoisomerase I [Pseudomonas aeruginosa]|uniref:type I DNA topoisomerase n=1 Tax=Pseudomonas aeruginosa TaxID=287 RepID=UPI00071B6EBA|nr:type I DNA topoisomerase [Pseudomonas aeruginosa]KSQ21552.1 DNA topoisomerase I [Pseudomonas aeruginosa]RPV61220.1 DNA topoisomerase 1 [Pseudomonas aeruginosa]
MSKTLVIVESPAKAKKIQALLGPEFKLAASVGHFRDLPRNAMGVSAPDFRPEYVIDEGKLKIVKSLKALVKEASMVYLATDLDREGEAIAWHLKEELRPKNYKRMTFNAVTKKVLMEAMASAGDINYQLVAAQEGRRVLDRIIGYTVSPLLTQLANSPVSLSAGRVQSSALLLIVRQERAISSFVAEDHYKIKVHFPHASGGSWTAQWQHKPLQQLFGAEKTNIFTDQATTQKIAAMVQQQPAFMVLKIDGKKTYTKPPAAFTTATLQQAASVKLGFSVDRTMSAAQNLFTQGAITYHRTDSENLDPEPVEAIRDWLQNNGFAVPDEPNTWKAKAGAQEAHEGIRPTVIEDRATSEFPAGSDEAKLYELIWERAVASQMEPACYFSTQVLLASQVKVRDEHLQFLAKGRQLLSPGWKALTQEDATEEKQDDGEEPEDDGSTNDMPALTEGQQLTCSKVEPITATTKPPARFTEASLVKALEAAGVGRPSTYGSIIKTLYAKGYTELTGKKKIVPLALGMHVIDILHGRFSFVDLEFTRIMEGGLDKIAAGQTTYKTVVSYQHTILMREIEKLEGDSALTEAASAASNELFGHLVECPVCSKGRLTKKGTKGSFFYSCSAYPQCTATCRAKGKGKDIEPDLDTIRTKDSSSGSAAEQVLSEENCPKCKKKKLALRTGTRGPFWSCSGYPKCKASYNDDNGKPVLPAS